MGYLTPHESMIVERLKSGFSPRRIAQELYMAGVRPPYRKENYRLIIETIIGMVHHIARKRLAQQ